MTSKLRQLRDEYANKNPFDSKEMIYCVVGLGVLAGAAYLLTRPKRERDLGAPLVITMPPASSTTPAPATTFAGGTTVLGAPASTAPAVAPGTFVLLQDTSAGGTAGGSIILVSVQSVASPTAAGIIEGIIPVPGGTNSSLVIGQQATFNLSDVVGVTTMLPSASSILTALETVSIPS